jgi:hypothetical protein
LNSVRPDSWVQLRRDLIKQRGPRGYVETIVAGTATIRWWTTGDGTWTTPAGWPFPTQSQLEIGLLEPAAAPKFVEVKA